MKNIVLVGFMGTGKTSVAKELSKRLNMKYVSTDDLIEKREEMTIAEIFSKKGEAYFRKVEKVIVEEVSTLEDIVIDAGGGVVIDPANVKNLKSKGIIICLWAEPEIILERTKKYRHRPLLNTKRPLDKIKELLDSRKPFYQNADYHLSTSKMSLADVADEVERIAKNAPQDQ